MTDKKCPFCGSTEIIVDTPYYDKHGERITSYCCLGQKKNAAYRDKMYEQSNDEDIPDLDEISKL